MLQNEIDPKRKIDVNHSMCATMIYDFWSQEDLY